MERFARNRARDGITAGWRGERLSPAIVSRNLKVRRREGRAREPSPPLPAFLSSQQFCENVGWSAGPLGSNGNRGILPIFNLSNHRGELTLPPPPPRIRSGFRTRGHPRFTAYAGLNFYCFFARREHCEKKRSSLEPTQLCNDAKSYLSYILRTYTTVKYGTCARLVARTCVHF